MGSRRMRWLAAAAIVVLVGVALAVLRLLDDSTVPPADESTRTAATETPATTAAPPTTAFEITPTEADALDPVVEDNAATGLAFMRARAVGDAALAMGLAADGQIELGLVNGLDRMPLAVEWMQAVGWEIEFDDGCELSVPEPANTWLSCTEYVRTEWSRALGVGPYEMTVELRINKGEHAPEIYQGLTKPTVTQMNIPTIDPNFRSEVWQPLVAWIEAIEPHAAGQLLLGASDPDTDVFWAGERRPLISEETIELWRSVTSDFVLARTTERIGS